MNHATIQLMTQFWPQPGAYENAVEYFKACAMHLNAHAEANDVILTIERVPLEPLAMRNTRAEVQARARR